MNTDETAKSTEAAPLVWTASNEWGASSRTYRAEANGWKYAALQPVKGGEWRVQGWGPNGDHKFYREAKTLKLVKSLAGDHATAQAKAAEPVADLPTELAQVAPRDMSTADLPAALAQVATSAARVTASLAGLMTRIGHPSRPWTLKACSCPTPTHRMSCGIGARPKVVPQDTYDFGSDHLALAPVPVFLYIGGMTSTAKNKALPCPECGRRTSHKLDCSKGRAL